MKPQNELYPLKALGFAVLGFAVYSIYDSLSGIDFFLFLIASIAVLSVAAVVCWEYLSKSGRERRRLGKFAKEVPSDLTQASNNSVFMGVDQDMKISVFLPDSVRSKHVHIIGATGSGKTESVILNFLRQDVERGFGSIILDAKGDISFMSSLREWVPADKLKIFDLSSDISLGYDPLEVGSPLEAAQRLFSSLTWSEEYYKSKAFAALQHLFEFHFGANSRNPKLNELLKYLSDPKVYAGTFEANLYSEKQLERDFVELSGLRDQLRILNSGYLSKILSPEVGSQIHLGDAENGGVMYFRLQSLLSPQLVSILGKLLINHLNFLAGTAHRAEGAATRSGLIPTYLDEFASFACPEFADLISKARSAGFALHFSHQSIGDVAEVSQGFLSQITDNSATKIVLRINDPDSADFFSRSFGTKLYQKVTQRVTNSHELDRAEVIGEGSQREAHQYRSHPDLLKTLPTGMGSVLIAHGQDTPHGASTVFKIKFPKLERKENSK